MLPWCVIEDFNAIVGVHEHNDFHSPNRTHMEDFASWSVNNSLIDFPPSGPFFTWHNGRRGNGLVERKLDRAFGNNLWISLAHSVIVSTLSRLSFDHYPFLVKVSFNNHRSIASSFKFLSMWFHYAECDSLISKVRSTPLVGC